MVAVLAIVAGILVAAALDNRLGWGTLVSAALAIYCHRLYKQPSSTLSPPPPAAEDDELRPGWAARWGRAPNAVRQSAVPHSAASRQKVDTRSEPAGDWWQLASARHFAPESQK